MQSTSVTSLQFGNICIEVDVDVMGLITLVVELASSAPVVDEDDVVVSLSLHPETT